MLPYLQEVQNPSKKYSVVFKGINYGEATQDGEFAETYNLSTDQYPCITQRAARISAGEYTKPSTLHAKGKLLVIDGVDVMYGGTKIGEVTEGKKQTATIGNYIVIFPDKKYYRVPTEEEKEGEFGNMEATFKTSGMSFTASKITMPKLPFKADDTVVISGCSVSENNKEAVVKSATNNELTFDDDTFVKAKETGEVSIRAKDVVYTSSDTNFSNDPVDGSCMSFRNAQSAHPFKVGDTIVVSGCTESKNNKSAIIKNVDGDRLWFGIGVFSTSQEYAELTITKPGAEVKSTDLSFETSSILRKIPFREGDAVAITGCSNNGNNKESEILIRDVTDNVITFDDNAFTEGVEEGEVTITRTVPDLDFICESNYRLWGTHGNTIFSSKFSDPLNFKVFDGLANDSYAIEVGSEGDFTGCMAYSSHICFFKENTLHKLYGTKPSNFQITTVNVYGVQSGSEKSMQIVNEQLLYKGVGGVYAYTGGVPELISDKFGNNRYSEAVACCDGEKYYISMKQGDTWNMFVYDVLKNIWLREDDTQAVDMAFHDGKVYYLDAKGGLYYIDKMADRSDIEWGATFCTMHETVHERKGYSKFHLRMDLSAGAWLAVDIKTDNDLQWQQVYTTHNEKAKTVSIPIMPTRCDSISIRLRGKGKCTIKSFVREFTVGSDV